MTDLVGTDLGVTPKLTKNDGVPTTDQPQKGKDFTSDQEVRWCPGCGDYVILNTIRNFLPELGLRRENIVFVSGIGWAGRRPSRPPSRWPARTSRYGWSPAMAMPCRSVVTT